MPRIVNLLELCKCEPGTVFSRYRPITVDGLFRLEKSLSENDFYYTDLIAYPDFSTPGEERLVVAEDIQRWGMYDSTEQFVVYTPFETAVIADHLIGEAPLMGQE